MNALPRRFDPDDADRSGLGRLGALDRLDRLPLWAQVLIAVRMIRRAALALLDEATHASRDAALAACEAMQACARQAGAIHEDRAGLDRISTLDAPAGAAIGDALPEALRHAIDATRAAHSAPGAPAHATVARAVRHAIAALLRDPRVSVLQVLVLLAADFDHLEFACAESGVGRHDLLAPNVFLRLAPVHAISLSPPPNPEPDWR